MFSRMIWMFALLVVSSWSSAHPGGDPPDTRPDPWIGQQCELPSADQPIAISYHIWYVGKLFADKPDLATNFCATVIGVQEDLKTNGLFLRLYPEVSTDICEQVPSTVITDSSRSAKINDFARALHEGKMTWLGLNSFTVAAKDPPNPYYNGVKINVYVLDEDLLVDFRGMHVRDVKAPANSGIIQGNLIFVPFNAAVDTLTHEFAHAFTLDHVNFWNLPKKGGDDRPDDEKEQNEYCVEYDYWDQECDFRKTNFMWAAGTLREGFTAGQKARIVCNDWSALNANGDRNGEVFKCPDWALSDLRPSGAANKKKPCPPLHDGIYKPAP